MAYDAYMISLPPNTTPTNVTTTDTSQQQVLATDLSDLSRNDVADYFKTLRLRHYVDQIIAKNEKEKVTTDVSIMDLQTMQPIIGHNLDTEQFAASVNKLPVAQLTLAAPGPFLVMLKV